MAVQLKNKIKDIQACSNIYDEQTEVIFQTGRYDQLISSNDREIWNYLCKKDFARLEKLLSLSLGEGYFLDDSDSDGSDDDKKPDRHQSESQNPFGGHGSGENPNDDDNYDHDSFMNDLLNNLEKKKEEDKQKEEEIKRQIREEEERA